jgi:hypothetical protein
MKDANRLINELRMLVQQYDAENEDGHTAKLFRDTFVELDTLMSNGGQFPRVWINVSDKSNQFSPPARCGHPSYLRSSTCTILTCANSWDKNS